MRSDSHPGVTTQILATESCMGCHSSAGIYPSYDPKTGKKTASGQLTGDFSGLLTQKAQPAQQPDSFKRIGAASKSVPSFRTHGILLRLAAVSSRAYLSFRLTQTTRPSV
jgi:hypothetical protein